MSPKLKPTLSAKSPKRNIALCYIRQSKTKSESDQDEADRAESGQDTPPPKKQRSPDLDSPERQRANIQVMCDRKGWIPKWFVDAEGHKSGRQEKNRPGWLALKSHLDDPDVVAIVANDLSRLHRKGWRVGQLIEWIEEHHLFLALAAPGRELDLSDPRDRLNASFISMMDEYYAADIAQRMRDSIAHRRSEGKTIGLPPFGTIRDEDGYLKPSPWGAWRLPDASIIAGKIGDAIPCEGARWKSYYDCAKRILELYSTNQHGLKVITHEMVKDDWAFRSRNGKPRRLTRDDVRRVIANWRSYAGLVVPGRGRDMSANLIDNAPGILYDTGRSVFDLALLRAVAEVQTARSVSTRPFGSVPIAYCYPLTGILYCARCEYRARTEKDPTLRAKIGGTNKCARLHYRHYQDRPCTCQRHSIRVDELEADFLRLLELLSMSPEQVTTLQRPAQIEPPDKTALVSSADDYPQDHLATYRRRLDAACYLFEDGDLSREEYVKRKEQFGREITHWEAQMSQREAPQLELVRYAEAFQRLVMLWSSTTPEDKQVMIRGLFESVYYDMDSKRIIDFQLKPGADRYVIARNALYEDEGCQSTKFVTHPDSPALISHFYGWSVLCPERATEPYHVHVFLVLLYGAMPPSASPVTNAIPPKTDRNKEIYQRYLAGESPSVLAREYGISEQRIFVIIRKFKHQE